MKSRKVLPAESSGLALHTLLEIDGLIHAAQAQLRNRDGVDGGPADLTLDVARRLLKQAHEDLLHYRTHAESEIDGFESGAYGPSDPAPTNVVALRVRS